MASVRKRTWTSKGETHSAWVVDYVDAGGTRRLKTFRQKKAADAWLVRTAADVATGTHTADRASVTLAQAAELWIAKRSADRLEASTLRQYRSHVDQHIAPALGAIRLSQLTAPKIAGFADDLVAGHSRAMARKVITSLRSILKTAQQRGLVSQNVAAAVRISSRDRHREKVEIISPDEMRALLATAEGWFRPFLHVAVFAGLRASELRGLAWSNLDLKASTLTVTQRADEDGVIGSPKSESSRRVIRLPPIVTNMLKTWREESKATATALVFPNAAGKPRSLANIKNRAWGPLQVACGLADPIEREGADVPVFRARYGLHVTRHFYASWLIRQGLTPKRVQALMGHSTIKLTLDTYGHLWPSDAEDDARLEAAEAALLSPVGEVNATSSRQEELTA